MHRLYKRNAKAMTTALKAGLATAALLIAAMPAWAGPHAAQGYLGVDVRDVAPDQVAILKLKDSHGAEIVLVDHDAPAGKCGLHEHDVVLMMNGQAIEGQDQLRRMLHDSPPGGTVVLVVSRDGQPHTVTTQMAVSQEEVERQATMQRMTVAAPENTPVEAELPSAETSDHPMAGNSLLGPMVMNPSYTGLYLEKMSSQLAGYFGVPNGSGLLVRSVQENSPAATAGMHAGDVVVRANDKSVASSNDWAKAIKNSHGHSLTVVVMRDKKELTLTLTPDSKIRSYLDPADFPPQQDAAPVAIAHVGFNWMPQS
jgi:serine protease Do